MGSSGLEPPTSRLSGVRSNHLSYEPMQPVCVPLLPTPTSSPEKIGGDEENRTPDPLLARQVLSQLSYTPKLGLKVVLSDFFSLSAFAPAFPSFSYENESQLSYTPKGDSYSLMESPALRASSFKIEQYRFKNL